MDYGLRVSYHCALYLTLSSLLLAITLTHATRGAPSHHPRHSHHGNRRQGNQGNARPHAVGSQQIKRELWLEDFSKVSDISLNKPFYFSHVISKL